MAEMAANSIGEVLTVPGYRRGPSVLGLMMIAALFAVPGLVAPNGVFQLVGAVWFALAVIAAVRDIVHVRRAT